MQKPGRLLLLDSASLYFRAFHGVPESVTAPDGTPVNAVRGFLDTIARLVTERRPARMVACWDEDWRPAFRVAAIPSYKAHRVAADGGEEVPAGLVPQVPVIVDVLAALGIARRGAPGFEADDVIGTLVEREVAGRPGAGGTGSAGAGGRADGAAAAGQDADGGAGAPVEVVTGDRDLFQLVDDAAGVSALYTAGRGRTLLERVDQAWLRARYGIPSGAAYADLAILRGDPSDGLPGVPGIGEKTAAALLARHGDLDALLAAADGVGTSLTPAQRTRIRAARDYLAVAPAVVRVARDAPVADGDDTLPTAPADPAALEALAQRWNLTGPVGRVLQALTAGR
ncbi:5'-3' exonuclease [Georgenia sp. TF02-10]|uniref:5'-3' exonuclease n=1 Tax=Georgenia sp. TF02-10 TaxID=2917725 RepID=UPI001FA7E079|nr:5'-3' exonuclease [Georgenia sp. TF02-10]UNX55059.1 5'-3' exonuclease [Georgenia sp. TF02-10]